MGGRNYLNQRTQKTASPASPTLSTASSTTSSSTSSSILEELRSQTRCTVVSTLLAAAITMSKEDFQELLEKFRAMSDGKKELDRESFLEIMTETLSENFGEHMLPVFHRIYEVFDIDGNGKIDFVELVTGISTLLHGNDKEVMRMIFSLIDVSGDGNVQQDEMIGFFKKYYAGQAKLGGYRLTRQRWAALEHHLKRIFIASDLDRNGEIDFEEFFSAVSNPDHPLGMIWMGLRSPQRDGNGSPRHYDVPQKLHTSSSNLPPPSKTNIKPTKFL